MYTYKKGLYSIILIITLAALLVGCASAGNSDSSNELKMSSQSVSQDTPSDSEAIQSESAPMEEAVFGKTTETTSSGLSSEMAIGTVNQKIIYTATLSMQVDEFASASTSLRNAIHQSGGYLLQFQDTKHEGEIGSSYTIKVPAAGFMSFIERVEQIKHNDFERNIAGKDVSEEYVDLESRLKAKQLVESRLLGMMDKATKADDLLKFSQQLDTVQEEIERMKGRVRYLDNNVAFSTVELRMYQTNQTLKNNSTEKKHLGGRMSSALVDSTKVVLDGLNLLLVILAGAVPILILMSIILIPVIWFSRKRKTKANKPRNPKDEQPPEL